jgi:hypothetical protein
MIIPNNSISSRNVSGEGLMPEEQPSMVGGESRRVSRLPGFDRRNVSRSENQEQFGVARPGSRSCQPRIVRPGERPGSQRSGGMRRQNGECSGPGCIRQPSGRCERPDCCRGRERLGAAHTPRNGRRPWGTPRARRGNILGTDAARSVGQDTRPEAQVMPAQPAASRR